MLFGESQDYPTACQLLDDCMAAGVNFFDSAEMYPVPQRADTQGLSEVYLGKWMKQHSRWATAIPRYWSNAAYRRIKC
jgi:N-acetyltransferase 10